MVLNGPTYTATPGREVWEQVAEVAFQNLGANYQ